MNVDGLLSIALIVVYLAIGVVVAHIFNTALYSITWIAIVIVWPVLVLSVFVILIGIYNIVIISKSMNTIMKIIKK